MKDYYDIWRLSQIYSFQGKILVNAISATFLRRNTKIPQDVPIGLSEEFAEDANRTFQWKAFLRSIDFEFKTTTLEEVIKVIIPFLMQPMKAAAMTESFDKIWKANGPWYHTKAI